MDRRSLTRASLALAGTIPLVALATSPLGVHAQTPDTAGTPDTTGTPDAAATPGISGVWESADDPIVVEWDTAIFGDASTSGVTGEWCVLRIPDIDRFLSFIIKLEDNLPTSGDELKDFVENDPELDYPGEADNITRVEVAEGDGAYGVLYQVALDYATDTWSYSEFIPSPDGSHRTIQIWIASRRSKLDREFMESAVSSVMINGEQAIRAIDIADLFDQVEAMHIPDEA